MEKRVSYYVSRKSFLVWLSALVMTASAALRIAYSCGKGPDASTVWFQIVLPAVVTLGVSEFMRKKDWIKMGDMKLEF